MPQPSAPSNVAPSHLSIRRWFTRYSNPPLSATAPIWSRCPTSSPNFPSWHFVAVVQISNSLLPSFTPQPKPRKKTPDVVNSSILSLLPGIVYSVPPETTTPPSREPASSLSMPSLQLAKQCSSSSLPS